MRRLPCYALLATALVSASGPARAQDPSKIAEQYVKAAGGSKALSRVQTETLEGTFTNPVDGKPATYTFSSKLPTATILNSC
jgi:hypothetical protein